MFFCQKCYEIKAQIWKSRVGPFLYFITNILSYLLSLITQGIKFTGLKQEILSKDVSSKGFLIQKVEMYWAKRQSRKHATRTSPRIKHIITEVLFIDHCTTKKAFGAIIYGPRKYFITISHKQFSMLSAICENSWYKSRIKRCGSLRFAEDSYMFR